MRIGDRTTGLSLYEIVWAYIGQVKKVGINERAAAISFNLVLALPAALLFLFSIIPYLPGSDKFEEEILLLFKDISPNSSTYFFIRNILKDLLVKHVGIFSFGFLLLVFYASNAMMGIIRTFDRSIDDSFKKSYFLHRRIRAIMLTVILIFLFILSATLLIGQDQMETVFKKLFHLKRRAQLKWWDSIRWAIMFFFLLYGNSFIYKYAPSFKKRWRLITIGSILATVLTLLTTLGFGYWVNHFASYNKVYGPVGTVLVIMMLIYINSLILLFGFELNVGISLLKAQKKAERRAQDRRKGPAPTLT